MRIKTNSVCLSEFPFGGLSRLLFLSLFVLFCSCQKTMTKKEKDLIYGGSAETPFRVLLSTNAEDSLMLRKKSIDIEPVKDNADLQMLIQRMRATLEVENGVGIAAPQIGVSRNVFLFMRIDKPGHPMEVAVNPKITARSGEMVCFEDDGCLSVPDVYANSLRYEWIEVEYYNEEGEKISERLEGYSRFDNFTGIIFQHEYDHLQGVLFVDRLCE